MSKMWQELRKAESMLKIQRKLRQAELDLFDLESPVETYPAYA